jgi:phosphatidylglycerophosphate synthase
VIILKYLADFLTFSRLLIAAVLVGLGWLKGSEGLQLAAVLMVLSWASDMLDGSLARRSRVTFKTWIGNQDLYFDMLVAVGLLIYLSIAGYINTSLSIIYILIWIVFFWWFGILSVLGKLFQAPIYAWFIFVTFQHAPIYGWMIVIFLLIALVFTWPRFPQETVPGFLSGFQNTKDKTIEDLKKGSNNSNNSIDGEARHP